MSEVAVMSLEVGLVGGFRLSCEGLHVELPSTAQRLLAFLALQERPVARSRIAFTLWAETSEARATGSLRSALWKLRRCGHAVVEARGEALQLAPDVVVDLRAGIRLAEQLISGRSDGDGADVDPRPLLGELLPGWYDDWVIAERQRFDDLRLHALEALCDLHLRAGRFPLAVEAGLAATKAEPLRESCRRSLIRAYLAEGNHADAIAQYHQFADRLRGELGLEPSLQIQELVRPLIGPLSGAAPAR